VSGYKNTSVGSSVFNGNIDGIENSALGYAALSGSGNGDISFCTAIGAYALTQNEANYNTAVGWRTLNNNLAGIFNTALGTGEYEAGVTYNVPLISNETGSYNTAAGTGTLGLNVEGDFNSAFGIFALHSNLVSENTGIGSYALYSNESGIANTAIGTKSLYSNVGGATITIGGWDYIAGSYNTAVGYRSLYYNSIGFDNSAFGAETLFSNTTGYYNVAIGGGQSGYSAPPACPALYSNTTGYKNTAVGVGSMYSNVTGYGNTSEGAYSLFSNTTGIANTAVGGMVSTIGEFLTGSWNISYDSDSSYIYNLCIYKDKLYASGFGSGQKIYVFDNSIWGPAATLPTGALITSLCVFGDKLVASDELLNYIYYTKYGRKYVKI